MPVMDITLPLKIAFIARSFLTGALRAWIGFGVTRREPLDGFEELREVGLFEPNLTFGGAMVSGAQLAGDAMQIWVKAQINLECRGLS